jgi:type II secretory pathway pseudopilin PulG
LVQQQTEGQGSDLARPTSTMMDHQPSPGRESGFTIIEVMVAAFVLLVGVLGTLALIDSAMGVGSTSRSREAATNIGREIIESARQIDYNMLLTSTATGKLQALPGLADADAAAAGWQLKRRGVTFTVTVNACIYDDPKDGSFSQNQDTGAGYCPGMTAGNTDPNGDDYRKITVSAAWGTRNVKLVANIVNPAGGFGPRITNVTATPAIAADGVLQVNAGTTINVTATTTAATSLNWDAGDTKHGGQLANAAGATSWPFAWDLGSPPATYNCAAPTWTPDAPAYEMTMQPFDNSTPGDLRTQIVAIDRNLPYATCDFTGGRNPQHGAIIDLQWRASFEGDVVSYSVWRDNQGAEASLVCADLPATVTECPDDNPPSGSGALSYYIKAKQNNWSSGQNFGLPKAVTIPAVGTANVAPSAPGSVTLTPGATPTIAWSPSTDSDGSVIFYRIYRDGQNIANRYARTSNAASSSFVDKDTGGSAHSYRVSAVDNAFAESAIVPAS